MDHSPTRRKFLASGTQWAGASLFAGMAEKVFGDLPAGTWRPAQGDDSSISIPGGYPFTTDAHGMIVYSEEYITREMPPSFVTTWITPTEHFFVRNNEHMPRI